MPRHRWIRFFGIAGVLALAGCTSVDYQPTASIYPGSHTSFRCSTADYTRNHLDECSDF